MSRIIQISSRCTSSSRMRKDTTSSQKSAREENCSMRSSKEESSPSVMVLSLWSKFSSASTTAIKTISSTGKWRKWICAFFHNTLLFFDHRDLKPENILLEANKEFDQIKIIDFGTSLVYDPSRTLDEKLGTPYYIAPEVLNKNYDSKCDIWSCGVITYILLSGQPPFNGQSDQDIMKKVRQGQFDFEDRAW